MLYRDKKNAWISGVCAGLAKQFDLNVIGIRLVFIVLGMVTYLLVVITYLILTFALKPYPYKEEDDDTNKIKRQAKKQLPTLESNLTDMDSRVSEIENYVISERFSFQRQLHSKD